MSAPFTANAHCLLAFFAVLGEAERRLASRRWTAFSALGNYMDILLTGSVAYDYLMTFPGRFQEQILPERLASISLSFLVDSMSKQRGGIAPNIAYTMALLG